MRIPQYFCYAATPCDHPIGVEQPLLRLLDLHISTAAERLHEGQKEVSSKALASARSSHE